MYKMDNMLMLKDSEGPLKKKDLGTFRQFTNV